MFSKAYSIPKKQVWLVPLIALPSIFNAVRSSVAAGPLFSAVAIDIAVFVGVWGLIILALLRFWRSPIVTIHGGEIVIHRGTGRDEPSRFPIASIVGIRRQSPGFLTLDLADGVSVSLEQPRSILDPLQRDLAALVPKNALPSKAGETP